MLPVSPDDDRAEGHRYEEAAVTEVFGTDAPALDQHGYLKTHGGIWVEIERAAATAPSRSARFERTRLARRLRGGSLVRSNPPPELQADHGSTPAEATQVQGPRLHLLCTCEMCVRS